MPVFVDTNLLVYSRDGTEQVKQPQARDWLAFLWESHEGRLSFQVLHEFYVSVTRKLKPGLSAEEAQADVRDLLAWRPITADAALIEATWGLERRYGLSFWDALIVASASAAGCTHLLTEDLQHDQDLDGVVVVNPFLRQPGRLA